VAAVEQVVDDLLEPLVERLKDGEVVDAFPALVSAVPVNVVALLVGAPPQDLPLFRQWNEDITGVLVARTNDNSDAANQLRSNGAAANAAMRQYFMEGIEARRSTGSTDDLVGIMGHSPVELDEEQRRAHLVQLIWAGSDSTAKLLSNTMVTLAQYPDQRRAIAADRSLVPQAIEESLRYQTVSYALPRIVRKEQVRIGDVTIPHGEKVVGMTAGANRDPARWDNPDRYDINRPQKAHVGFGTGIHSCIGVHVARLEARIWLNKVLDRIPEYQLTVDDDEIEYGSNIMTRGPVSIPISLS
jgi:cytochrome P450